MNTLRMKFLALSSFALALAMITLLSGAALAQDSNKIWTGAASTGVPDEASQDYVVFTGSLATIGTAPVPTTVTLRYNVTALDGLFTAPLTPTNWPALVVRYRDSDANNMQVIVELKEHILSGPNAGQTNTLITFNSEEFPQVAGYQTQSIGNCGVFSSFKFKEQNVVKAYFIEARLIRSGSANNSPGLAGLAITRDGVCQGFGLVQQ